MRHLLTSSVFWFVMVLAFVSGALLVMTATWLQPLADAEQARRDGNLDLALERYVAGEARFDRLPVTRQLLPLVYRASQSNQLWVLHQRKEYDALIEKAEASPSAPATHFWAGCAFFEKAMAEQKKPDTRMGWFRRAEEEFRKALELDPADWDTKFNYEVTRRLLNAARKQPRLAPPELLKFLRPQPEPDQRPTRRTG